MKDLIRSIILWILILTLTVFLSLFILILSIFRAQNWIHNIATLWGTIIAFLSGTEIEVVGKEKIYKDGPVVILSNHQSMFDIIIFYSILNIQFRWMAKSSLFKIPVGGWAMSAAGYIPVERDDPKKAKKSLFSAAQKIKNGASVILFPEGTRGKEDGKMLPFKKGGFVLAKLAGVTIQPVTIWGANKAIPKQKGKWIQRFYKTLVQVHIHDPIPPSEVKEMKQEELSNRIRETLETPMSKMKLRQEVEDSIGVYVN
ncbi:MAG: 1-acyl-sn-glycerol-3-phosphate acyltransferase [Leptospiraceae bacterium]|nr:1-acyl-sn-glycerol-3-phosphate acyltransferase [Leptospiraceae bacterium]